MKCGGFKPAVNCQRVCVAPGPQRILCKNLPKRVPWKTNQKVRSAGSGNTKPKAKLWQQPRTRSQPPMRQRTFELICAPGVTPGILRKIRERPGRIADRLPQWLASHKCQTPD